MMSNPHKDPQRVPGKLGFEPKQLSSSGEHILGHWALLPLADSSTSNGLKYFPGLIMLPCVLLPPDQGRDLPHAVPYVSHGSLSVFELPFGSSSFLYTAFHVPCVFLQYAVPPHPHSHT